MIPPVLSALMLLGSLLVVGLGLAAWVVGRLRSQPRTRQIGGRVALAVAAAYAVLWVVTVPLAGERRIPIGGEVSFCGVDCHLHVSVAKVDRGESLGVSVRLRSNARVAAEYPSLLRFEIVDAAGQRWLPSDGLIAETLPAGASLDRTFQFSLGSSGTLRGLAVSRPGIIDYLLVGRANPLVQRRFILELESRLTS